MDCAFQWNWTRLRRVLNISTTDSNFEKKKILKIVNMQNYALLKGWAKQKKKIEILSFFLCRRVWDVLNLKLCCKATHTETNSKKIFHATNYRVSTRKMCTKQTLLHLHFLDRFLLSTFHFFALYTVGLTGCFVVRCLLLERLFMPVSYLLWL